jgi:hypothetical protein
MRIFSTILLIAAGTNFYGCKKVEKEEVQKEAASLRSIRANMTSQQIAEMDRIMRELASKESKIPAKDAKTLSDRINKLKAEVASNSAETIKKAHEAQKGRREGIMNWLNSDEMKVAVSAISRSGNLKPPVKPTKDLLSILMVKGIQIDKAVYIPEVTSWMEQRVNLKEKIQKAIPSLSADEKAFLRSIGFIIAQ